MYKSVTHGGSSALSGRPYAYRDVLKRLVETDGTFNGFKRRTANLTALLYTPFIDTLTLQQGENRKLVVQAIPVVQVNKHEA